MYNSLHFNKYKIKFAILQILKETIIRHSLNSCVGSTERVLLFAGFTLSTKGEVRKSDTRSLQFVSGFRELISEKVNFLRAHKRTPVMKYELDKGKLSRGNRSFWCEKKGRPVASK